MTYQQMIDLFHQLYYDSNKWCFNWMGFTIQKYPGDMMIYQDIIFQDLPDYLVETGTAGGGAALYYAMLMDYVGKGRVISVDILHSNTLPEHPRIEYITGDSVEIGKDLIGTLDGEVLVSLDSDHSKDHVLKELEVYSEIVTPGQYMVIEDTNINGHPVRPNFGPGPYEAMEEWRDNRFVFNNLLKSSHLFSMHHWARKVRP